MAGLCFQTFKSVPGGSNIVIELLRPLSLASPQGTRGGGTGTTSLKQEKNTTTITLSSPSSTAEVVKNSSPYLLKGANKGGGVDKENKVNESARSATSAGGGRMSRNPVSPEADNVFALHLKRLMIRKPSQKRVNSYFLMHKIPLMMRII